MAGDSVLTMNVTSKVNARLRVIARTRDQISVKIPIVSLYWENILELTNKSDNNFILALPGWILEVELQSEQLDYVPLEINYNWLFDRRNPVEFLVTRCDKDVYEHTPVITLKKKAREGWYHFITYCTKHEVPRCSDGCVPKLVSWNQAAQICSNAGGHLPHFLSRAEQEELISIMKTSRDLLFMEALFIGLTRVDLNR